MLSCEVAKRIPRGAVVLHENAFNASTLWVASAEAPSRGQVPKDLCLGTWIHNLVIGINEHELKLLI